MASLTRHLQMWLESVRRAWRRGEAGMNMYRMLMANSEAVEESRGHARLSTNRSSPPPPPRPGGRWGDRWWISLTTAKVTRLKGPCGPPGGARACSFYYRLDLWRSDTEGLYRRAPRLMSPASLIQKPLRATPSTWKIPDVVKR